MSSAMGKRWAEICTEVTERIKALGPNPVRRGRAPESGVESQETAASLLPLPMGEGRGEGSWRP